MAITTRNNKSGLIIIITNETWLFKDRKSFTKARATIERLSDEHKAKNDLDEEDEDAGEAVS